MAVTRAKISRATLIALAATVALTGCASSVVGPTASPAPSEKTASTLGTRICFTNETDLPISAAPGPGLDSKNAGSAVGSAGVVTDATELCFAGWDSYKADGWSTSSTSYGQQVYDVATSTNIDGVYTAIEFRGINTWVGLPNIYWTTGTPGKEQPYDGRAMNVGDSVDRSFAGHSFIVTRRGDSDNYKEFLVRFTQ